MSRFKHLVDTPTGIEGFRAKYHVSQGVALRYCAPDQIVIDRKERGGCHSCDHFHRRRNDTSRG